MEIQKRKTGLWPVVIVVVVALVVLFRLGEQTDPPSSGAASDVSSVFSAVSQPQTPQIPAQERAKESIPRFELKYYLNSMNDDALHAACDLYEAAMRFDQAVEFTVPVDEELFYNVLAILADECPELFQVDYGASSQVIRDADGKYTKYWIPYRFTEGEYQNMRASCEAVIDGFVSATAGNSDYEKEKYVFDYIASRDQYDKDAPYADTAYGALVDGWAKCDGFSCAMKWAMEAMGIQCLYVSGNPVAEQELGHAWNIIRLDGRYYRVDLTASVPFPGQDTYGLEGIKYTAFNVTDGMAAEEDTQYELRAVYSCFAPVPACDSVEMNYFYRNGGFLSASDDYRTALAEWVGGLIPDGGYFFAQFESGEAYNRYINDEYHALLQEVLNTQSRAYGYQTVWYGYNCIGIRVWFE